MGLSQSLYTGYSGMHTHQKSMDNLSNNLANVNTVGYKKSDFMFGNLFKQAINGATPGDNRGTTNPKNVGMGVTTGAIATNFSQTNIEGSSNPLDCAISGNGFFVVETPRGTALTRNGSFYFDATSDGNRVLCAGNGLQVQGWNAVNGVVTPSQNVGNIIVPPIGSKLTGEVTTTVDIKGIIPSKPSTSDFSGSTTTLLELKGNLPAGESSLTTEIYMPVSRNGGDDPIDKEVQPVKVRIDFVGPTTSADGKVDNYSWTMTTVDWPNVGDEGIQIYPTPDSPTQDVAFYAEGSLTSGHGAGESATGKVAPGSSKVKSTTIGEDGEEITTFFTVPTDFNIDASRLTHVANAPGGNELQTWYANGNPTGTMARTVSVFDETTSFEPVKDSNGVTTMQAVRSVEERKNAIFFTLESQDNTGSVWAWESSIGGDSGSMSFDTEGNFLTSQQTGSRISYDFSGMKYINHEASVQVSAQDGYTDGLVTGVEIDENGRVWAMHDNKVALVVAQIAMGNVPNSTGLVNSSGTLFYPSIASGGIMIGVAGDEDGDLGLPSIGAGSLVTSALESSNVNLAQEFASMIAVERGYQFNSRIVTTSNEMLQTALQLK